MRIINVGVSLFVLLFCLGFGTGNKLVFEEQIPNGQFYSNQIVDHGRYLLTSYGNGTSFNISCLDLHNPDKKLSWSEWPFSVQTAQVVGSRISPYFAVHLFGNGIAFLFIYRTNSTSPVWAKGFPDGPGYRGLDISDNGVVSIIISDPTSFAVMTYNLSSGAHKSTWITSKAKEANDPYGKLTNNGKFYVLHYNGQVLVIDIASNGPEVIWSLNVQFPIQGFCVSPSGSQIMVLYTFLADDISLYSYSASSKQWNLTWNYSPKRSLPITCELSDSRAIVSLKTEDEQQASWRLFTFDSAKPVWEYTQHNTSVGGYLDPLEVVFSDDGDRIAGLSRVAKGTGPVVSVFNTKKGYEWSIDSSVVHTSVDIVNNPKGGYLVATCGKMQNKGEVWVYQMNAN
eukprot:TRINITY_DN4069_c0_g1_i1.p1 TRINITY_DN4069_c0_g1~~TRINITY_DN4069_c0_g1_i1.p1  ORF type:complete len:398 (+),score=35.15 TRINITY_DN4069_c0_g1_i1:66-1259(+)